MESEWAEETRRQKYGESVNGERKRGERRKKGGITEKRESRREMLNKREKERSLK